MQKSSWVEKGMHLNPRHLVKLLTINPCNNLKVLYRHGFVKEMMKISYRRKGDSEKKDDTWRRYIPCPQMLIPLIRF